MCLNHVKINDKYRISKSYTYYSCGKCVACKQALANKRSQKIRNHHPNDYIAYFVTLTYSNAFLPYIDLKDLNNSVTKNHFPELSTIDISELTDYKKSTSYNPYLESLSRLSSLSNVDSSSDNDFSVMIPIYRNTHFTRNKHKRFSRGIGVIDYLTINDPYYVNDIRNLRTITSKRFNNQNTKISIAYNADWQNFVKRLRTTIFRRYGRIIPLSFYYAPEYGPTTQRFHIHALIWFPSEFTSNEVKSLISKAWPFCTKKRLYPYIQVARDASSYVASYATSSVDVSPFLAKIAPLRSSHSLHFGFDNQSLSFESIIQNYNRSRKVVYALQYVDSNGQLVSIDVPYPKYILSSYFPRLKGWSRLSDATRKNLICLPEKYYLTNKIARISDTGVYYYFSNIIDVYGQSLILSHSEFNYFLNSVQRAFIHYNQALYNLTTEDFKPLFKPYTIHDYFILHNKFYNTYKSYIYSNTQSHSNTLENLLEFSNLDSLLKIPDYSVIPDIAYSFDDISFIIHPDYLPYNVKRDNLLIDKYKKHLKTRKLNHLYG